MISKKQTIVFTDSGLGGLSIMADFYNIIKNRILDLTEINIIFFNALPETNRGYNRMTTVEEKVNIFNAALESITKLYNPNKIAIACNTLSSIFPSTFFAKKNADVLEIISCGIAQIKRHQSQHPEVPVFILATPTTITSGAYNFANKQVYPISGDNLASLIEFNYESPQLKEKVKEIVVHIKEKLQNKNTLSLFLGCTHYAYIKDFFLEIARESGLHIEMVIDPAEEFIKCLLASFPATTKKGPQNIILKIESQAEILNEEIESISRMVKNKSPEISELLRNYTRLPKSF